MMKRTKILDLLDNLDLVKIITPVGSRVTCDPPPTNTDEDHLILVRSIFAEWKLYILLRGFGFVQDVGDYCQPSELPLFSSPFKSFRYGKLNLIITRKPKFYSNFLRATEFSKKWNITDKKDRIVLFQAMLYGK